MAARLALDIGDGIGEAIKAALLVEMRAHVARGVEDHAASAVSGAEIDPEAEFAGTTAEQIVERALAAVTPPATRAA